MRVTQSGWNPDSTPSAAYTLWHAGNRNVRRRHGPAARALGGCSVKRPSRSITGAVPLDQYPAVARLARRAPRTRGTAVVLMQLDVLVRRVVAVPRRLITVAGGFLPRSALGHRPSWPTRAPNASWKLRSGGDRRRGRCAFQAQVGVECGPSGPRLAYEAGCCHCPRRTRRRTNVEFVRRGASLARGEHEELHIGPGAGARAPRW